MYKGRILIFEDDLQVGKVIKLIAEASGFEAQVSSVPERFFKALDEWMPTHISIDLVMPDMDGAQVLDVLVSRNCSARIIVTSGRSMHALEAVGRAGRERGLNVAGVLAKPFSASALRALLLEGPDEVPGRAAADSAPDSRAFDPSAGELSAALQNREFKPVYQPKIQCSTGLLAGFEVLARWFHPGRGRIMPEKFMPLLERAGLIDALSDAMLDQALPWFCGCYLAAATVTLSINYSAMAFGNAAFLDRIVDRCRKLGIPTERLIFELPESESIDNPAVSRDLMAGLRDRGFLVSINDFGTGYSSLLQFARLPFSEIKVDKSFVSGASRSEESREVVKSIVNLGRSLGLDSAAEGVEDLRTLAYLKRIGCTFAQGYAIAAPMDADSVRQWADSRA